MITLFNDLAIKADENCYILGKPYTYKDKAGKEITVLQNPSYHTTMAHALEVAIDLVLRRKINEEAITDLQQYISELGRLHDDTAGLLNEYLA